MRQSSTINLKTIVTAGFFAAVTFLGIQMFRIPLPAAVGTPFVHFGHIFVVLGCAAARREERCSIRNDRTCII